NKECHNGHGYCGIFLYWWKVSAGYKTFITDGIQGLIDTIKIFIMLCVAVYISLKGYTSITGVR
ncbi:hypothetical protein PCI56_06030, partial [Plesiomonas shigelloides subsp. oncorhynchi]|nr:hypothetical protein [Plesiomonas shigelloides]